MSKILIIGAGRSTIFLIDYLLDKAAEYNWQITLADMDRRLAEDKIKNSIHATAIGFDIHNSEIRRTLIQQHDIIISMLPANMHTEVAQDCVEFGKHMATASYVSTEMKALDIEARNKGILLLNECGLDPGIDHASAKKIIDEIHEKGGEISSFKSYCGGLMAPQSNNNPWGYKFSWAPRNVVLAGQCTAQYLSNGALKLIPYNRLFIQTETITINGENYDGYANRDSNSYIGQYGLTGIKQMLRGTLRQHGYCKAWNVFVKLGLTDDSSKIFNASNYSYTNLSREKTPKRI
jgi:saccharopine dehydrogenase-like NADP-dependent oxidoreductase